MLSLPETLNYYPVTRALYALHSIQKQNPRCGFGFNTATAQNKMERHAERSLCTWIIYCDHAELDVAFS